MYSVLYLRVLSVLMYSVLYLRVLSVLMYSVLMYSVSSVSVIPVRPLHKTDSLLHSGECDEVLHIKLGPFKFEIEHTCV